MLHAHFAAPDAPEPCDMAPTGRQWFSLADRSPASMADGVTRAADALNTDIDARLAALGLAERDLALVGFSQGTMTSLQVAYRRAAPCAGVLGFSGRLVGADRLGGRAGAPGRRPFWSHGDADDLAPVGALFEAATTLGACGVPGAMACEPRHRPRHCARRTGAGRTLPPRRARGHGLSAPAAVAPASPRQPMPLPLSRSAATAASSRSSQSRSTVSASSPSIGAALG